MLMRRLAGPLPCTDPCFGGANPFLAPCLHQPIRGGRRQDASVYGECFEMLLVVSSHDGDGTNLPPRCGQVCKASIKFSNFLFLNHIRSQPFAFQQPGAPSLGNTTRVTLPVFHSSVQAIALHRLNVPRDTVRMVLPGDSEVPSRRTSRGPTKQADGNPKPNHNEETRQSQGNQTENLSGAQ